MDGPVDEVTTSCGVAQCDTEGLFRVPQGAKQVSWILVEDECLQARLMVCAHVGGRDHRAKISTLHELRPSCAWGFMEADVGDLVGQRLH